MLDDICPPHVAVPCSEPVPCSPEAERWLIGCVLKRPSLLDEVSVPPSLFLDSVNQRIWSKMLYWRGVEGHWRPWNIADVLSSFEPHTPEWDRVVECDWSAGYWEVPQFVAMLERTAEARRLLWLAQDLAEAAYRSDLGRAAKVLASAGVPGASFGFDIPEVAHGR